MTAFFEKILEMSLTSAIVIAVVLVIRLCLRKAPRKYSYALWSVAAFRLVCPVSFKAVFSLFRFVRTVEGTQVVQTVTKPVPTVTPGYFDSVPPEHLGSVPPVEFDPDYFFTYPLTTPPGAETPVAPSINWMEVAAIVWLIGLAALIIYGVVSYVRLRRRMGTAVALEGNVWQSDRVQSPFILGFIRPKIYLPFGLTDDQRRYVLAHERYHIKRLDHIVRPLSYLILAVHWFNPLVWLAYYLMARDMEMSCDEKVLSTEGNIRKAYSTTLLSFAANRRFPSPSPLAFGESGVKGRIKNALNWKKPRTWVTVIAVIVCIVVIVVCAANPKEPESDPEAPYDWTSTVTGEDWSNVIYYVVGEGQDRFMTEAQRQKLAELLNGIPQDGMEYRASADGHVSGALHIDFVDGVHFIKYLPDGSLIISELEREGYGAGKQVSWEVDSDELKQFIRDLPDAEWMDTVVIGEGYDIHLDYLPYKSVACVYMNPLSSYVAFNGDSGQRWFIGTDRVTIYSKYGVDNLIADFAPAPDWRPLTTEEWEAMFLFSENITDITGYGTVLIRNLSEEYALAYADGALWAVEVRGEHIWAIWLMEPEDSSAPPEEDEPLTLAVWQADLTHDGVDETITVRTVIPGQLHDITVTKADGAAIWSAEAHYAHAGHNGIYLYEHDGFYYLMQWLPYMSTGSAAYTYRIFGLNEDGMEMKFADGGFSFSENFKDELMRIDIPALRAFEDEINALLADATVLLSTNEFEFSYSTPDNPITHRWTSPADRLEERQQDYLAEDAKRQANTLATWPLNDLTVTVLKTEDENVYTLDVYGNDYFFWSTELRIHPSYGDTVYLIYRENGTEYLAEFTGTSRQGVGMYSYRVFTVRPESLDILYENSLYYEAMSEETVLTVDLEAIRAFEDEVNGLFFRNADIICGIGNGQMFWNPGGSDTEFYWRNPDFDRIQQEQQRLTGEQ